MSTQVVTFTQQETIIYMNPNPEVIPVPETGPENEADSENGEPESKSQRKRNAHQITELAAQLVQMKPKALKALPLESGIQEAIVHCAEIKAHGARKRQLHFVSKLLRETENIEELKSRVLYPDLTNKKQALANPHLAFRDRLIENFADTVDDLQATYPDIELQQVRQLVRNAHSEQKKAQDAKPQTDDDTQTTLTANNTKAGKTLLKLLTRGG